RLLSFFYFFLPFVAFRSSFFFFFAFLLRLLSFVFFFNHPATTEIYTLSLHDALPICPNFKKCVGLPRFCSGMMMSTSNSSGFRIDRKSTRLNSSHGSISYAVFCLKKKKKKKNTTHTHTKQTNNDKPNTQRPNNKTIY